MLATVGTDGLCLRRVIPGQFQDECLDQYGFASVEDAQQTIEAWRIEDHTERLDRALGQQALAFWEAAWTPTQQAPS